MPRRQPDCGTQHTNRQATKGTHFLYLGWSAPSGSFVVGALFDMAPASQPVPGLASTSGLPLRPVAPRLPIAASLCAYRSLASTRNSTISAAGLRGPRRAGGRYQLRQQLRLCCRSFSRSQVCSALSDRRWPRCPAIGGHPARGWGAACPARSMREVRANRSTSRTKAHEPSDRVSVQQTDGGHRETCSSQNWTALCGS